MTYIFCIFAAVLIWFSVKSFLGGIAYLRYFRAELSAVRPDWQPFATIIAPCKGLDDGLEQNLTALIELDYPEYEVIFVVDDPEDPAVKVIQAVSQTGEGYGKKTALTVAPKATDSSQKVENLREGVIHADPRSEVVVFVDSDARPSPAWLRALVAPLRDETIGATTGYR
ncbi:MAG: glycosyltransferase, partial [Blastocatellia bacterium]|nr:glycosyltransferase [Blastocatellia bacterium]